jgi:hypothetical protein
MAPQNTVLVIFFKKNAKILIVYICIVKHKKWKFINKY